MNILRFRFELTNPFDRWELFKNLGCVHGMLTENTAWELEHTYYSPLLFDLDIKWNHKEDHAGFEIVIGILGYGIHFHIYDTRHWDHDTNAYTQTSS